MKTYAKEIYVYVADYVDERPVLSVANTVEEIPLDVAPCRVGKYRLESVLKYRTERRLIKGDG